MFQRTIFDKITPTKPEVKVGPSLSTDQNWNNFSVEIDDNVKLSVRKCESTRG